MNPENAVIMKGGPHAGTGWDAIVEWKVGDLRAAGVTFWGYGGTLCDPTRQVQPFAQAAGGPVHVAMTPTGSDPGNAATDVSEMSPHGVGVRVTGSKWALVMDDLEPCQETIDLRAYAVAIGAKAGAAASEYLRHRVDKGCFRRTGEASRRDPRLVVLRGRLVAPWAVFLR